MQRMLAAKSDIMHASLTVYMPYVMGAWLLKAALATSKRALQLEAMQSMQGTCHGESISLTGSWVRRMTLACHSHDPACHGLACMHAMMSEPTSSTANKGSCADCESKSWHMEPWVTCRNMAWNMWHGNEHV